MNSLGARLFGAFAFIILLVLLSVGVALLLLLRNNPLVERQTTAQLTNTFRALRQDPPPADLTAQAAARYVAHVAQTFEVRALVTSANGEVLADSEPAGTALNLRSFRGARREPGTPGALIGNVRDANRQNWLYMARPLGPDRVLVLAASQPRFAALAFFAENLFLPMLEAGVIAALLAAALAVLISRSIALPLQKMAAVAQGISRGDYSQSAPTGGPDEVGALGLSINTMSKQVQATQQAQRDFLANVSHELKTPLTSIQGFAQAVLDGAVTTPDGLQRSAGIIYDEADRMRRLVEGLLDLARLDAGLRALNRAPLDLRLVLLAVVEKFNLRAREKGVSLHADVPPVLPTLVGDADRLAQVFTNLLDNALEHTPAGSSVTLSAASEPGAVVVNVQDTGTGIPPQDLHRIFERFYQVDKSRAARARSGGVGLGLTITKEIVEAHGGSLSVESAVGRGSTFTVRLPLVRPDDTTVARRRKA